MVREEIVLKLEALKQETKTYTKLLQVLDRSGLAQRTGPAMRFFQARPQTAINQLLRENGAQTQEQLMRDLEAGGIAIGRKRKMHNPRIAIEKMLKTGALKKVGDLIGLPEWSDEKFKP
jgi:hypothetical protein